MTTTMKLEQELDSLRAAGRRIKELEAAEQWHIEQFASLKSEYGNLAAERDAMRVNYRDACTLVAQMHHAATGCVTGPAVGVVEDVAAVKSERDAALKDAERLKWKWSQYVKSCDAIGLGGYMSYPLWIEAIDAAMKERTK